MELERLKAAHAEAQTAAEQDLILDAIWQDGYRTGKYDQQLTHEPQPVPGVYSKKQGQNKK